MHVERKSIFRRSILSFSVILFLLYPSAAESFKGFEVHSSDERLKEETADILNRSYHRIPRALEDSTTHIVTVYLADTEEEFRVRCGGTFPDWGVGCAIPSRYLIIVKSPIHFRYGKSLGQVLEHELAHVLLGAKVKGERIPRRLEDGIAMMHSHEWTFGQDRVVAWAIVTNSVFPLSEMERLNQFNQSKAHLAYTLSFLAVSYLFREYGEESFVELVNLLSQGENWNEIFLKTTGSDYADFQMEFLDFVKKKYSWISFLGDTFFLWAGLAFLIVFIYLLKKRHTRKIVKRWEEEEMGSRYEKETD